jgi:outer membrane protein TolC
MGYKLPEETSMHEKNDRPVPVARAARALTAAILMLAAPCAAPAFAQGQAPPRAAGGGQTVELTLERMVQLGLRDSFRIRQLQLAVERTRSLLRAQQAGLKSRVELNVSAPSFQAISENKWNSDLQRNELVAENTRRWQADLSVRQPVMLFGYPTNGVLSLNNRVYRYTQIDGQERDNRYYNRYFVGYEQPLFQPNRMKNDLEEAELELESSELDYQDDVVGAIDDLSDDYYQLLEAAYRRGVAAEFVADLEGAVSTARAIVQSLPERVIERDQLEVELANARESLSQAASNFRLQVEDIKQRLRLGVADDVTVDPSLDVVPVDVDVERAIELARTLAPRLRQLGIDLRQNEIQLDEARGNNAFRMNLNFTYGREVQDPYFRNLWTEPRNSYTVDVSARVPIWDWGQRHHRIQAQQYSLDRTRLSIEEAMTEIETNVRSQVRTLDEYKDRLVNMQNTLGLAQRTTLSTMSSYASGAVTLVDLLQTISREASTARNFLAAFMGYQRTLLRLKELTYFDFEFNMPVVERFAVAAADGSR